MELIIIAAIAENYVIGNNNQLIWHLPNDLKRFKKTTLGFPIIMGRKTFESLGSKPLPKRQNIIISSQNLPHENDSVLFAKSLNEAILKAKKITTEKIFILGGGQIFTQAIEIADKLDITKVHQSFVGDVFFPTIDSTIWQMESEEMHQADDENKFDYSFCSFVRRPNALKYF